MTFLKYCNNDFEIMTTFKSQKTTYAQQVIKTKFLLCKVTMVLNKFASFILTCLFLLHIFHVNYNTVLDSQKSHFVSFVQRFDFIKNKWDQPQNKES